MRISYDEAKRLKTLKERGLDFRDADKVFDGITITGPDNRRDYGEDR
ncbi:BrnT family toxin [Sphingobium sp. DEHP117]|nr:BrnT family toxin [Sphingobium sp. DEHP117]MDQ4420852.1 BrnT family toxin [Sphingobium sp. DEHP117]